MVCVTYNSPTGYVGMDFLHRVIDEIEAQSSEVY